MQDNALRLANLPADRRAALLNKLGNRLVAQRKPATGVPRRNSDVPHAPLSYLQEQLWFLEKLSPGQSTYNIPSVFRLRGELDVPALQRALGEILQRHDALRTRFEEIAGVPRQVVMADLPDGWFVLRDLSDIEMQRREEVAQQRLVEEAQRPFDLYAGPLLRGLLLRLDEQEHILAVTMHHICSDGWSTAILTAELTDLYSEQISSRPAQLPRLEVQYADYAAWQRTQLGADRFEHQLDYWSQQLAELPTNELPTDRPRPVSLSYRSATVDRTIDRQLLDELRAYAGSQSVSLFMVLMAAYLVVLARYSGEDEIVVGTTTTGRDMPETKPLIGYFVNMIVLRVRLDGDPSFTEVLRRVRETVLDAWRNQEVPFDRVVQRVQPPRDPARNPLFQVGLQLLGSETQGVEPELAALDVQSIDISPGGHPFDMSVTATESPGQLRLVVDYSIDLFDRPRMQRMLGHLESVLRSAVAAPDQAKSGLNLLQQDELDQLLTEWQGPARQRFHDPVHVQIAATAARWPDAIAAKAGTKILTYAALDARADQLARRLRRLGVAHGDIVALFLERGFDQIIGMLAAQKAGGAFVVLDVSHPVRRLEYLLSDTAAKVVLTNSGLADRLPAAPQCIELDLPAEPVEDPLTELADENSLAYVLYTSGSSGKPKGVLVEHHALSTFIHWMGPQLGFMPDVRLLQHMAPIFDFAEGELFAAMVSGATIVFVPEADRTDPEAVGALLISERIDYLCGPPAILGRIPPGRYPDLKGLIAGGEAVTGELVNRWNAPGRQFINGYGPTEAAIGCAFYQCEQRQWVGQPPIGRAMPNRVAYVLDRDDNLQPVGVPGEVVVGGEGLARGYLNLPELTAAKFVSNPFRPGERMYRTGDLGMWTEAGQIQFLGRIDNQIKLNGLRIELEEIESALTAHPDVVEAAVGIREGSASTMRLVGYLVPAAGRNPDADELREFMLRDLPSYMVPHKFVTFDSLPLTAVGKVDRNALPQPGETVSDVGFVEPRTEHELQVSNIFATILGQERVGVSDGFFDLGGSSLDAARVLSRIGELAGVTVSMRDFYANPKVGDVAGLLDRLAPAAPGAAHAAEDDELQEQVEDLQRRLDEARRQLADRDKPATHRQHYSAGERAPLSSAQEQLWFLEQLAPGRPTYNIAVPIRLTGPIDVSLIRRTLGELIVRHDALRTTFGADGDVPYQQVNAETEPWLTDTDLGGVPDGERETALTELLRSAREPFDLGRDLLLRSRLIRLSDDEHVLSLVMHHIASDGWSVGVLARDFGEIYDAIRHRRDVRLPALTAQFAGYAAGQRKLIDSDTLHADIDYWAQRLDGAPTLELPADRSRPGVASNDGALLVYRMPPEVLTALHRFSQAEQVSAYATLLAAFCALLHRYTGEDDIVVGSASSGRSRSELEDIVGFFVNVLPIRLQLVDNPSFRQVVHNTMSELLTSWEHQEAPFDRVVGRLNQPRDASRNPLFQISLDLLSDNLIDFAIPGLATEFIDVDPGVARFDMAVNAYEGADGITFRIEYATDLYDADRIERMFEHLQRLLTDALAAPDTSLADLALIGEGERARLLTWGEGSSGPTGPSDIDAAFAAAVASYPQETAVIDAGVSYRYRELDRRVNALAGRLRRAGADAGQIVGVMLERGVDEVAACLAVLRIGAAYSPIDIAAPPRRLAYQLSDTAAKVVVTVASQADRVRQHGVVAVCVDERTDDRDTAADELAGARSAAIGPGSLAYVLYTSGSTGEPKGVLIEHGMVTNFLSWLLAETQLGLGSRMLHCCSPVFDVAAGEILGAVTSGAALVIASYEDVLDVQALGILARCERVTHVFTTPTVIELMTPGDYPDMQVVMTAGEPARPAQVTRWAADPARRVLNVYGPAETSIASTWFECPAETRYTSPPPIGRMMPNRYCYLLDRAGRLVPQGVPGELVIGGVGVSRGYLSRPELTAAKFVPDPLAAQARAVYRTGDLARWNADGELEFVGRIDTQVKLRGLRIELGEIEHVLQSHPEVERAAVAVRRSPTGEDSLVGYLISRTTELDLPALRGYLADFLPAYMIPSAWLLLEEFPVSRNGKLDRQRLPDPIVKETGADHREPTSPTERAVAEVIQRLLVLPEVSADAEFFALGGNSLQAIQAVSRINEFCDSALSVRDFYTGSTISGLAELIDRRGAEARQSHEELLASVENMSEDEVERLLAPE